MLNIYLFIYHKIYKHICRYDEYVDRARYAAFGTIEPFWSYSLQQFRESDVFNENASGRKSDSCSHLLHQALSSLFHFTTLMSRLKLRSFIVCVSKR